MESTMRTLFTISLIWLGISGCKEPEDECTDDQRNTTWCDGNKVIKCYESGMDEWLSRAHNALMEEECTQPGTTCVEADCVEASEYCDSDSDTGGLTFAYCGLTEKACPEGAASVCVNNVLGDCSAGIPYPTVDVDCKEEFCKEQGDAGTAECSPLDESCETEDEVQCSENMLLTCKNGMWSKGVGCYGACEVDGEQMCRGAMVTVCKNEFWQEEHECLPECGNDLFCRETVTGMAVCTQMDESCDVEGELMCHIELYDLDICFDVGSTLKLACTDGVWQFEEECADDEVCCDVGGGGIGCTSSGEQCVW